MSRSFFSNILRNVSGGSPHHPASRAYRAARKYWRLMHVQRIRLDQLLCGGEQGMNGRQFALHTGDLKRTSTPIQRSPHTTFLLEYQRLGDSIFTPAVFEETEYFRNAVQCMRSVGAYFNLTREEQIVHLAKHLVARFNGQSIDKLGPLTSRTYSETDQAPLVLPISHSNCYQVLDGNHRLGIACARGDQSYPVRVVPQPQLTCLQQLLLDVSWNLNKKDLYQPLQSPELGDQWRLVRRCTDRFAMMRRFLEENNLLPPQTQSYVDIACNYGWFLKAMQELRYETNGVELDWAARQIGIHFYGLKESQIIRSEIVRFFHSNKSRYDVVSCFSLVHHFVLGRGAVSAEQLIQWLDGLAGKVLFFEMGDENESWFRQSLTGWNPKTIRDWILKHTTFKHVIPLGTDQDRAGSFEDNYGRTLFACLRSDV